MAVDAEASVERVGIEPTFSDCVYDVFGCTRQEPTSGVAPEGSRVQDGALADEHMGSDATASRWELQRKESNLRITG